MDYETGKIYCEEHGVIVFERLLEEILNQYPMGKTIMILDNARIHHNLLQENKDRLELVM